MWPIEVISSVSGCTRTCADIRNQFLLQTDPNSVWRVITADEGQVCESPQSPQAAFR